MTVSNTTTKITYVGDGKNRTFGIPFPILSAADLRVVITDSEGVETSADGQFTVNMAQKQLTYPTVGSRVPTLSKDCKITILRQTPLTQEIDLHVGHALDAAELESGYDKLTYAVQEIKEEVGRAVKTGVNESAPETAEAYMDAITAAKEAAETAATSAAGSASEAVVASATAAAASTEATTQAQDSAQSVDTATSAAVTAQSAMEGAQVAQAAAETAAASIATAISEHNQSTDAHVMQFAAKQPKTLDTAITVAGESKTTVETALSAINTLAAGKAEASHTHSQYLTEIPKADANTLGGIKPDGVSFVVAPDGTASATGNVTVDSALSDTSKNPVQNKVVKAAIDNKQEKLPDGATGLFLKKTANGVAWARPSGGGGGGSAEWGNIGGTLTDQTDLKNALDAKQDAISDLSTIRTNATAGAGAAATIAEYGDVVTHNASEFQAAGNYATASHTHTASEISGLPTVPTKTSQLQNDSGFITDVPVATASVAGKVKPDGTTITAAPDGTISAVGGGSSSSLTATYDSTNKVLTLR